MRKGRAATGMVLFIILLLFACAGTKLIGPWRDPAYTGRLNKVVVLGVVRDRGPRSLLEEEFVRQLKARGVEARASTSLLPDEAVPAREALTAKVRENGADSVLVARFIRKGSAETHEPTRVYAAPQNVDAEWEMPAGTSALVDPGLAEASYDYSVVVMRTTVYSVATGTAVWSSLSETRYQGPLMHQIKPFVSAILGKLAEERMVP